MAIRYAGGPLLALRGGDLIAATRGQIAKILRLPAIIRGQAAGERTRWSLWIPAFLAGGAAIYFALPVEPEFAWVPAGAALTLVAGWCSAVSHRFWLRVVLAMLAALSLGFAAARLRTEIVSAPVLIARSVTVPLEARVVQAEPRGYGSRMILAPEPVERFGTLTPARVRLTVRAHSEVPKPGSWVRVLAVLMPPPAPAIPGDYDFGRWAYYQRIGAIGYVYGRPKPIDSKRPPTIAEQIMGGLEDLRTAMTERVRAVVPGREGVIAAALITGERADIDPDDQSAFRDSGLMHVLSISGLHLALAGGVFFWVIRALFALFPAVVLRYPIKKWAAAGALAGSTFYLLVSGCEPPAVRSWVMLAIMFGAILVDRPALSMRSVMLAAIIVILATPENVLDPGCQMSFAAVTALIALAEWQSARARDEERKPLWRRAWRYVAGICITSTIAGLATAPIAIFHFDRASPFGIIANLLALPVVGVVIMPSAVAAMVTMPFGLDVWPLILMGKGVGIMLAIAHWVADLPGAGTLVPVWPGWCVALVMGGGTWIALWQRGWRWFGLVSIAIGLAFSQMAAPPDILATQDLKTVAVRLDNGKLALTGAPDDKYAAMSWLRRAGDGRAPQDAVGGPGLRCDGLGCIVHLRDQLVAIDARAEALAEDCANAEVVVTPVRAKSFCRGPQLVLDRNNGGSNAIWLGPPLRSENAEHMRGYRPWSRRWQLERWRQYRRINPTNLP
jgi:competence protein ComEC